MRLYSVGLVASLGFLASSLLVPASATQGPHSPGATSPPTAAVQHTQGVLPAVSARAYIVFDLETGEVIVSEREHEVLPVASVTKLATAAAILDGGTDTVDALTITAPDTWSEGVVGAVAIGERYQTYELLFPLLLTSSNHAANALARHDSSLVPTMNSLVQSWGAGDTTFADASGLSAQNRSNAADLMTILRRVAQTHPHLLDISRLTQYVGSERGWQNNSPFSGSAGYLGGKHGYTEAAKRTFAGVFEESLAGGERPFGYVVLGSDTLVSDVSQLRDYISQHVTIQ